MTSGNYSGTASKIAVLDQSHHINVVGRLVATFFFLIFGFTGVASSSDCLSEIHSMDLAWPLEGVASDYEIFLGFSAPWRNDEGFAWGTSSSVHLGLDVKLKVENSNNTLDGDEVSPATPVTKGKKIYASFAGEACRFVPGGKWGGGVYIKHEAEGPNGQFQFYTIYHHIEVSPEIPPMGDCRTVEKRDVIGTPTEASHLGEVFNLENSHSTIHDRDHLHFALRCDDSEDKCGGGNASELVFNGGKCVDPTSFFPTLGRNFSDVPQKGWYTDHVSCLANQAIIQGYPDWTFKPEGKINRAELLKILIRSIEVSTGSVLDLGAPTPESFKDDSFPEDGENLWFIPYVRKALELSHEGNPLAFWEDLRNATMPDEVTREEFARILYAAKKLSSRTSTKTSLEDIDNSPFRKHIVACEHAGYISGRSEGSFEPEGLINRAEASKLIALAFFNAESPVENKFSCNQISTL